MKTLVLVIASVLSTSLFAASPDFVVGSDVRTQQLVLSEPQPSAVPPRLAFSDQDPEVRVEFLVRGSAPTVVSDDWWKNINWTLSADGSQPAVISAAEVKLIRAYAMPSSAVRVFEADFQFPKLAVGKYVLRTTLQMPQGAAISSEPFHFEVRTGSEDRDTRRAYLRFTSDAVASTPSPNRFETFRALMLELAELEPRNPYVWERLGDIAATSAPSDETAGYYAHALTILEETFRTRYGDVQHAPKDAAARFNAQRRNLTAFSRAVRNVANGERIGAVSNRNGVKTFVVFKGEAVARQID